LLDQFPVGYHPYILDVVDDKANRHCGYRVVAAELGMGDDTTQLDKQMTKDITNTSQLGQSFQHLRQGLTKHQKDLSRRRTGQRLEHQMFFLLVFLQDKFM